MTKKLIIFGLLSFLFILYVFGVIDDPDQFIKENQKQQKKLLKLRLSEMKEAPDSLFFAKSSLSGEDQEILAKKLAREIDKLSKVSGFDTPDHQTIFKKLCRILKESPDSKLARVAHWNIFPYFNGLLGKKNPQKACRTLESFLEKYRAELDEFTLKEAYDQLSLCSEAQKSWGLMLYYSDQYLSLNPGAYPQILNKATALQKLGQKILAAQLCKKIIQEAPDSVQSNLASALLDKIALSENSPKLLALYTRALKQIREISGAVEMYRITYQKIPPKLSVLVPDYLKVLKKDPWGNSYELRSGNEEEAYFLICLGSNGEFEGLSREGRYTLLEGKDLIFAGGFPYYWPAIEE